MRPSFNNDYGGTFVLIEPGSNGELVVEEPFFIGARPVTQVEWTAVMGTNPSKFQEGWSAGLRPVESVSWLDCQRFISKLNEVETEQRLVYPVFGGYLTAIEWELHAGLVPPRAGITPIEIMNSMRYLARR